MEIQTKYQVGQSVFPVWFSTNTRKYVTKKSNIVAVFIYVHNGIVIDYTVDNGCCFSIKRETMVFGTEDEANNFLYKYNDREWYTCPMCGGKGFTEDGSDCGGCYGEGAFEENFEDEDDLI